MTDYSPSSPPIPAEQRVYGRVIYGLAYLSCLLCLLGPALAVSFPERNVLPPTHMFETVLSGGSVADVWAKSGGFPGAHFYRTAGFSGDALTQFGLAFIGGTASAWGLLAASFYFVRRRAWGYALLALGIVGLVWLSALP